VRGRFFLLSMVLHALCGFLRFALCCCVCSILGAFGRGERRRLRTDGSLFALASLYLSVFCCCSALRTDLELAGLLGTSFLLFFC